jgi:hypothetical protein
MTGKAERLYGHPGLELQKAGGSRKVSRVNRGLYLRLGNHFKGTAAPSSVFIIDPDRITDTTLFVLQSGFLVPLCNILPLRRYMDAWYAVYICYNTGVADASCADAIK